MPATNPRRGRWYDMMITIIKSVTTLAVEWMRWGGHF